MQDFLFFFFSFFKPFSMLYAAEPVDLRVYPLLDKVVHQYTAAVPALCPLAVLGCPFHKTLFHRAYMVIFHKFIPFLSIIYVFIFVPLACVVIHLPTSRLNVVQDNRQFIPCTK